MDNFVEKRHLTTAKPSIEAGFNNLPISRAKIKHREINDLQMSVPSRFDNNEADSYKVRSRGITPGRFDKAGPLA